MNLLVILAFSCDFHHHHHAHSLLNAARISRLVLIPTVALPYILQILHVDHKSISFIHNVGLFVVAPSFKVVFKATVIWICFHVSYGLVWRMHSCVNILR